jgi:predicted cupin superfamily sugar epimerase
MNNSEVNNIINHLKLTAHPEGGYYNENYRSSGNINPDSLWPNVNGTRSYATGIYFLLKENQFSAFHKIKQDEMWHHYLGDTLLLHIIDPKGNYNKVTIGKNLAKGEHLQYVVLANHWFASEVLDKKSFVLCGCTVSPGFDFNDFEMPKRSVLVNKFPQHNDIISKLSHP